MLELEKKMSKKDEEFEEMKKNMEKLLLSKEYAKSLLNQD